MSVVWFDPTGTVQVEAGFGSGPLAALPTWTDITADVRLLQLRRGRSSVHSNFDAGTMTVVIGNDDGDYDSINTSSPHFDNMKLGTPLRFRVVHSATTYDIFYGHITRWLVSYQEAGIFSEVALEVTENGGLLRSTRLQDQTYSQEASDVRIANILDDANWAAGPRALDTGVADVAALTAHSGSAGDLIDATVEAEQGAFFIAGDGDATFKNRVAFSTAASQATFGPTAPDLEYREATREHDRDNLINIAEVTGSPGPAQTASDATSKTDHGERATESTNPSIVGPPGALNVAEWIVGRNKDVKVRITRLVVTPEADGAGLWPQVLGRELQDLIRVKLDPPGGGTDLDQIVAIESIAHNITPDHWVTTYECHPVSTFETTDYWVLGTSALDTTAILA